jgi:hypothetical protein
MKTFEEIKSLLPNSISLSNMYYCGNLNESLDILNKTINNESDIDDLFDYGGITSMYDERIDDYIIYGLKNELINKFNLKSIEADEIIENYRYEIESYLYSINSSDVISDICDNTKDIDVVITLYSNYDCINSCYFEGGYSYIDTYFGDMVDALNLNPADVKKHLFLNNIKCFGRFPNKKNRIGKEFCNYKFFIDELINTGCGANNLVFLSKIKVKDLIKTKFNLNEVIVPKGSYCGLFSSFYGGGSILNIPLTKDVKLKLNTKLRGKTEYDCYKISIDGYGRGYSVKSVYGEFICGTENKLTILN